jgi:hypothetical protein
VENGGKARKSRGDRVTTTYGTYPGVIGTGPPGPQKYFTLR